MCFSSVRTNTVIPVSIDFCTLKSVYYFTAGTVIFRILKRTADFSLSIDDTVAQFQTKPLPLPKRSKLFLEQSMRERQNAVGKFGSSYFRKVNFVNDVRNFRDS